MEDPEKDKVLQGQQAGRQREGRDKAGAKCKASWYQAGDGRGNRQGLYACMWVHVGACACACVHYLMGERECVTAVWCTHLHVGGRVGKCANSQAIEPTIPSPAPA